MSRAEDFMQALEREILAHPCLHAPLVRRMATQPLTCAEARRFALAYYPHILRTRLYQANALGIAEDERVQFVLAMILYDEYGNGRPEATHPEVYRRLLRALDVDETLIASGGTLIPELELYVSHMTRLTQSGDWLAAAAAVGIASEWPIPYLYTELLKGLRTIAGITEADLELFSSHVGLDEEHSAMMREALARHAETEAGQARIREGVRLNLDARLVFHRGLYREVFEQEDAGEAVA